MNKQQVFLILLVFFNIFSQVCTLESGVFKDQNYKMQIPQEERSLKRKQNILHTLNQLGESYMDLVQYLSENVIQKIQSYLSLDYYLTNKQDEFQKTTTGFNQMFYQSDVLNEEEWKKEYKSMPEHKSNKFRMMIDKSLEKEKEKNNSPFRQFNSFERLQKNPTVSTVSPKDLQQEEEYQFTQIQRLLQQNQNIPDDGEITKMSEKDKCQNNSYLVLIEQTAYFCNSSMVQEQFYKHLTPEQLQQNNCVTRKLKFESCLCPLDYVGRRCELESRVYCDLNILNEPRCKKFNEFYYVSEYTGLPPCLQVKNEDFLSYHVQAQCRNLFIPPKEPKVYGTSADYKILFDEKPPTAPIEWEPFKEFKYLYKSDKLVFSRLRILNPQIQYINWNNLGDNVIDSYLRKYNLTFEQIIGDQPFEIVINFRNLSPNITTAGRYTIEINLFEQFNYPTKDPFVLVASGIKLLVFEQEGFIETFSKSLDTQEIVLITLLISSLVLLFSFVTYYQFIQKPKNRKRKKDLLLQDDYSLHENLNENNINKEIAIEQNGDENGNDNYQIQENQ
ncbi:transmembrane protein, putative (macronuclear) [Tetrahymena thermophila SB210]|uniref:Transmembrane protein, putative n=1 Tax=Tetrahymena thermophila (strain SB210) TaxID=312017 RepID=I7ML15_TETTS|nr:transmembrane protein, putative [Tetrahymena thermophila SB210]EAS00867.2 transmembrane protein, putative [Tetrahymena thermophila SB210]|eukprot:XP_001021112.2 transmembrane protein, putative [Tetrahymena thermophila SB210]